MRVYKTQKGHFYKEYKNGKKKRISKKEFLKLKNKMKGGLGEYSLEFLGKKIIVYVPRLIGTDYLKCKSCNKSYVLNNSIKEMFSLGDSNSRKEAFKNPNNQDKLFDIYYNYFNHSDKCKFNKKYEYFFEIQGSGPIGSGSFGDVYEAKIKRRYKPEYEEYGYYMDETLPVGKEVALKIAKKSLSRTKKNEFLKERNLGINLAKDKNQNIVELYGYLINKADYILILELLTMVDGWVELYDIIYRKIVKDGDKILKLSNRRNNTNYVKLPDDKKHIIRQLAEGIKYLHDQGIIHRDLKPENIMYNINTEKLKIFDFGLSSKIENINTSHKGTPLYVPPEKTSERNGVVIDVQFDIWSFGMIVYEIIVGKQYYMGQSVNIGREYSYLAERCQEPVSDSDFLSIFRNKSELLEYKEIILGCLKPKATRFQNMSEIIRLLEHPDSDSSQEAVRYRRRRKGTGTEI